jgi:hypothetical protein
MIPDGSWACFTDGDAMFTTPDFGHQLEAVVKANPEYDLFTSVTNRVGTMYQCVKDTWDIQDINIHREIGQQLKDLNTTKVEDITNYAPFSGVLILVRKNAWFTSERFKENGMLGVDNSIHYAIRNQGGKVGLMHGVYMMHYYRNGNPLDQAHLI